MPRFGRQCRTRASASACPSAAPPRRLLCADEKHRAVYLLQPADAKLKDQATGKFIFNDAWELTPDEDLSDRLLGNLVGGLAPCAGLTSC
mmetsp:Transcript_17606/g.44033  ORF Transcript_17606/g.44033 Transcript_17606/m.44033 type:complete len:90 (+) Transcript_17606:665-934(+)